MSMNIGLDYHGRGSLVEYKDEGELTKAITEILGLKVKKIKEFRRFEAKGIHGVPVEMTYIDEFNKEYLVQIALNEVTHTLDLLYHGIPNPMKGNPQFEKIKIE